MKNVGELGGDEVVQVYLKNLNAPVKVPIHTLVGFKRVHLIAGEVKTIDFKISPDAFSIINNEDERVITPGRFEIFVGGGQPESKGVKEGVNLLQENIILN